MYRGSYRVEFRWVPWGQLPNGFGFYRSDVRGQIQNHGTCTVSDRPRLAIRDGYLVPCPRVQHPGNCPHQPDATLNRHSKDTRGAEAANRATEVLGGGYVRSALPLSGGYLPRRFNRVVQTHKAELVDMTREFCAWRLRQKVGSGSISPSSPIYDFCP